MKITRVEAWLQEMKLATPYTIARKTINTAQNIFVRIETDGKLAGYGCGAPDEDVTGESIELAFQTVHGPIADALKGRDPLAPTFLEKEILQHCESAPAALAAVDMALYDLQAKAAGWPLYRLLGGRPGGVPISVTIGIMPVTDAVEQARRFIRQGFRHLKIKGGQNVDEDIERVMKIREAAGKQIWLAFDANEGYSTDDAVRFARAVSSANLAFIEQPLPRNEAERYSQLKRSLPIPLMLDESLLSPRDAFRFACSHTSTFFNIKLMKCGGLLRAHFIDVIAQAAGIRTMIGCMDEAALAIAAGVHFVLAHPNVFHADLDGHLDLLDDPTKDVLQLREGILYPNSAPGLGLEKDL